MGFIFDSEGNAYFTHPTYIRYASDRYGYVVDIKNKVFINQDELGYIHIEDKNNTVKYRLDNFVWECFNDIIPKNRVIKHIDGDKLNNELSNLTIVRENGECDSKLREIILHSKQSEYSGPSSETKKLQVITENKSDSESDSKSDSESDSESDNDLFIHTKCGGIIKKSDPRIQSITKKYMPILKNVGKIKDQNAS